jgi:uncharacterized protein (DUF1330 family)
MISAYVVFTGEKTLDKFELAAYLKEVPATLAGHDVRVLALNGSHEDLEGPFTEGTVISSFQVLMQRRLGITVRSTGKCA